jgi:ABC-type amino acid transport substrate-binding protein
MIPMLWGWIWRWRVAPRTGARSGGSGAWRTAAAAVVLGLLCAFAPPARAERFDIVYPRVTEFDDPRAAFAKAVVDLAMREIHADYTIRPSKEIMERTRALQELTEGRTINLHWSSMSRADEERLRAVPIPLHRGLIGYRVLVIRKDRQLEFDKINSLAQLSAVTGGQGIGWVDTDILRDAGLHIETATYDALFRMVQAGHIDYYPRGLIEAYTELQARHSDFPDLVVEKHLLLAYRSDFVFYTNRANTRLAAAIEKGLKMAYRDGSYMRLFNSHPYIQTALERAGLPHRTVIWIDNPYLSDEDRRIPDAYWMPLPGAMGPGRDILTK